MRLRRMISGRVPRMVITFTSRFPRDHSPRAKTKIVTRQLGDHFRNGGRLRIACGAPQFKVRLRADCGQRSVNDDASLDRIDSQIDTLTIFGKASKHVAFADRALRQNVLELRISNISRDDDSSTLYYMQRSIV